MARPLLLGLSLLRYNRAGAGLRLRRSCWLGLPTFKLGSGPGLRWSAHALLLTIHDAIWWTTEHQGAVGLRGGVYRTTQYSKDASSDTSACAEASYFRPTSLRYYTPE
eukprot:8206435-Pyramimonas_sp.AAC.1